MPTPHDSRLADRAGFTLLEVLIAVTIFAIGILGANSMQTTSIIGNTAANRTTESSAWATDRTEILLSLPYNDVLLNDGDNDGTGQDGNGDGIDDGPGNFGLDDTGANADGSDTSPDGTYAIDWNVAVDQPFPGNKTIRIISTSQIRGITKTVSLTYIKADSV